LSKNNRNPSPVIFGFQSHDITTEELAWFEDVRPWGVILFARNIDSLEQVRALTDKLRAASCNPHLPILIDQEGGRVARLRPPLVRAYPAAGVYRQLYETAPEKACGAAFLGGYLLAADLHDAGITINCAPCLDLGLPNMSEIIADRAFGADVESINALARAFVDGQQKAGVLSLAKHLPGHGRATVDSHVELPVVDTSADVLQATDFEVFKAFNDLPLGMTGHLLFTDIDADNVSTFSPVVIQRIIRQEIGFSGLLMSDDVSMHALDGDFTTRASQCFEAGCDLVLHCNGDMTEMQAVAEALPDSPSAETVQRMAHVDALLATQPAVLSAVERAEAKQDWGELIGDIFPDARNAV
jgi:beta-N-acetylhexosaminidase